MTTRYEARGPQAEFEPGSQGRVLRNSRGNRRVRDMEQAESDALLAVQERLLEQYTSAHRFTAADICVMHRLWLVSIYPWAGEYRSVNLAKRGFMFAAATQIPRLMDDFDRLHLAVETPCADMQVPRLVEALARTHAELVLIHPFREGNGRCARLLAYLMAMQAGLPSLDFSPLAGRGKRAYVAAIHAALGGDYAPMEACFASAVSRTLSAFEVQP